MNKHRSIVQNHHDYIAFHNDRFQGARIITGMFLPCEDRTNSYERLIRLSFLPSPHDYLCCALVFLYLNDVEEGGGTHFSSLGITVQPKVGRAVIWPSVLDHNPDAKDHRTNHEALPVIRGVKYGGTYD